MTDILLCPTRLAYGGSALILIDQTQAIAVILSDHVLTQADLAHAYSEAHEISGACHFLIPRGSGFDYVHTTDSPPLNTAAIQAAVTRIEARLGR